MTQDEIDGKIPEGAAMTADSSDGKKKQTPAKREDSTKTAPTANKKSLEDDFSIVLPFKHHHLNPDEYLTLQPAGSLPLFIYGSLLLPHILHGATGFNTPMVTLVKNTIAGTLYGYRRHALRNAPFPAIIPKKDHFVAGALVLGLNDEEKKSVEGFESGMYDRVEVDVEVEMVAGEMPEGWLLKTEIVKAETYVWNYQETMLEIVPVEEKEWSIAPLVKGAWYGKGDLDSDEETD